MIHDVTVLPKIRGFLIYLDPVAAEGAEAAPKETDENRNALVNFVVREVDVVSALLLDVLVAHAFVVNSIFRNRRRGRMPHRRLCDWAGGRGKSGSFSSLAQKQSCHTIEHK